MSKYKNLRVVIVINRDTKDVIQLVPKTRVEVEDIRLENIDNKYIRNVFICSIRNNNHLIFEMFEDKFKELFIEV